MPRGLPDVTAVHAAGLAAGFSVSSGVGFAVACRDYCEPDCDMPRRLTWHLPGSWPWESFRRISWRVPRAAATCRTMLWHVVVYRGMLLHVDMPRHVAACRGISCHGMLRHATKKYNYVHPRRKVSSVQPISTYILYFWLSARSAMLAVLLPHKYSRWWKNCGDIIDSAHADTNSSSRWLGIVLDSSMTL